MSELEHVETQIAAFEAALGRGRLHHAWLLTGPEGVGKASFAWRAAARLLGAPGFAADPNHPAVRLMIAGSHPDFIRVELEARDKSGVLRREITVDQARRLPEFFAKAPAMGRHRVAIIDSVDDLNTNAANAVLKTLEEPSASGVLLLVSHSPGRLLPTIRSRCRRLRFDPWPEPAVAGFLTRRGLDGGIAANAAGSPGRALALAEEGGSDLRAQAEALIDAKGPKRLEGFQALADGMRGEAGRARFEVLIEQLAEGAARRAREGGVAGEAWADAWRNLSSLVGKVEGLNLDRADALAAALADVDRARQAA